MSMEPCLWGQLSLTARFMFEEAIHQEIVLVGGGHSHVIALRQWAMNPLPGVRLTLLSEASDTPYSGMVPGYISGAYAREECYLDLRHITTFAGAQFYLDRVVGLDLKQQRVLCLNRPPVRFDLLSIDTGSTPTLPPTVDDPCVIPAKPIQGLLARWQEVKRAQIPMTIAVVGGGAGGVELCFAIHRQLPHCAIHLFHKDPYLLPGHGRWVQERVALRLCQAGITLHLSETVVSVAQRVLRVSTGEVLPLDYVFWVTQASAPDWPRLAGLAVDAQGFIVVDADLRSVSHPQVFAAGDIASIVGYPRPKAGVFAVRMGIPLAHNLRAVALGQKTQPHVPQKRYLSLISTGNGQAIASWGRWGWESSWLWRWKDHIDRQFMQRFRQLPTMEDNPTIVRCTGCGSKVGSEVLQKALQRLRQDFPCQVIFPLDDGAVLDFPAGKKLVQTVDHFPALGHDPWVFGQITAHHCLNDLFAMGATPQSVMAMVTLPHGSPEPTIEMLYQLLSGVLVVLRDHRVVLAGGHTIGGKALVLGLSAQGWINPDRILTKQGMQGGEVLILTKPLGVGTLFAAHMQGKARGEWIDRAIAMMLQSNQTALDLLLQYQASGCTDISGFGLIGHVREMLGANTGVEIATENILALPGALTTLEQGYCSSLQSENLAAIAAIGNAERLETLGALGQLLFDPQTSGGLIAAIPPMYADRCLHALHQAGYAAARPIGRVVRTNEPWGKIWLA